MNALQNFMYPFLHVRKGFFCSGFNINIPVEVNLI